MATFFAVLKDQLVAASHGDPRAPKLTIFVMSDGNISPLLAVYGLSDEARLRPPYLSALIHEVYEETATGALSVRVIYNGKVLRVCSNEGSFPMCPLPEWESLVAKFIPNKESCPVLYKNYDFLAGASKSHLSNERTFFDNVWAVFLETRLSSANSAVAGVACIGAMLVGIAMGVRFYRDRHCKTG